MSQISKNVGNNALSIYSLLKQFDRKQGLILLSAIDKEVMPDLWMELIQSDLLKPCGPLKFAACPDPECYGNGGVISKNGNFYVDCSSCLQISKLALEALDEWQLKIQDLLEHIRDELNLSGEFFQMDNGQWQLGFYGELPVIFIEHNKVTNNEASKIKLGYDVNREKNIIGLEEIFMFPFNCLINKAIFDYEKLKILADLTAKAERAPTLPNYSYAGFEIYCQREQPCDIISIKFKGEEIYKKNKKIRIADWEVLRSLVAAQGSLVSRYNLMSVLKGTRYDEAMGSEAELDEAISRLRNQLGVEIKTAKKLGYSLLSEQTLQKKS